jgi:hypothetical protein
VASPVFPALLSFSTRTAAYRELTSRQLEASESRSSVPRGQFYCSPEKARERDGLCLASDEFRNACPKSSILLAFAVTSYFNVCY